MSWNVSVCGHRAAVRAHIAAEKYVPPAVKAAIYEIIDDVTTGSSPGVRVDTHGHFGGGYSSITKLEVVSCSVVLDKPTGVDAAVTTLTVTLEMLRANEPIHRSDGNIEQADLAAKNAQEIVAALRLLGA